MANLPIYEQRTRPIGAGVTPRLSGSNPVLTQISENLSGIGNEAVRLQNFARQKAEERAAVWSNDQLMTFRSRWTEELPKRQGEAPEGADGFTAQTLSDFDKQSEEAMKLAPSAASKQWLKERLGALRLSIQQDSLAFEAQKGVEYKVTGLQRSSEKARVAAEFRPQDFSMLAAEQDAAISASGLSAAIQSKLRDSSRADLAQASIAGLIRSNPSVALKELNSEKSTNPAIEALPFEYRQKARVAAEREVHDLEVKQKAAAITFQANSILSSFNSEGPDGGTAALERLRNSGLSLETQADVYSKVQSGLNLMRNQQQEVHANTLADLQRSIANGTAGTDELSVIEDLWSQNVFTPTERASLLSRVEGIHIQNAGDQATAQVIQNALESGAPLDPSNSTHRKALSASFGQVSRETPVGSAPWQGLASAYAVRTRMLPDQAVSWARSALRSPDPKVVAPAAEFLGSIAATAPDALSSVDSDTRAFAGTVSGMIAAGTDPARAVETARQNVFEANPSIIEARRKAYSVGKNAYTLSSNNALDNYIDRDFGTLFTSQPTAGEAMRADFDAQSKRYYEKTGDIQTARDLAWADLKRVYGVTEVNGTKQMMVLPPERFGVSAEAVRQDISSFLAGREESPEDIAVVPDGLTLRAVADILDGKAQTPSYKLVNTKTGDLVLNEKGIPVRYTLPTQDELTATLKAEQEKAQALARKQVDQARFDRDSRRQIMKDGSGPGMVR